MDAAKISICAGNGWPADKISCLGEVVSTNVLALKTLEERGAAANRTVITAESQSAGHGRFGRRWFDVPGRGLALSVALGVEKGTSCRSLILLPLAGAVGVINALKRECDLHCSLKWPNDVMKGGLKIAGAMAEVRWRMEEPTGAVLGIGVNLNHQRGDFPGEIEETATSVFIETGRKVARERFTGALLSFLEPLLKKTFNDPAELLSDASAHWDHLPGQTIEVVSGGKRNRGAFRGVDENGALLLEEEGVVSTICYGDVGSLRRIP